MRTYGMALAMGVLALGIVLTVSGGTFAQSSAPIEFAVASGTQASDTSGSLGSAVSVVPVLDKRNRRLYRDWERWSDPYDWYYHWFRGRHAPEYQQRPGGFSREKSYCWSDGRITYCRSY